MAGKVIARALHALFLVDGASSAILIKMLVPSENNSTLATDEMLTREQVTEIFNLYAHLLDNSGSEVIEAVESSESMAELELLKCHLSAKLTGQFRTAKLWLQFMYYVETIRLFIRAERLSDWSMHETATSRTLNLFAARGHFNYAKSTRLYLQMIQELPDTHPWLYEQFAIHSFQSVRRSDRAWAGIWTDLAIEQILMRALKSHGGLTRGRGFTESVRLTWIHTMHRSAGVHQAMMSLKGLYRHTSKQHVERGKSRLNRDMHDQDKVIAWFESHNPFVCQTELLYCLSTGFTALEADSINCDDVEASAM